MIKGTVNEALEAFRLSTGSELSNIANKAQVFVSVSPTRALGGELPVFPRPFNIVVDGFYPI